MLDRQASTGYNLTVSILFEHDAVELGPEAAIQSTFTSIERMHRGQCHYIFFRHI